MQIFLQTIANKEDSPVKTQYIQHAVSFACTIDNNTYVTVRVTWSDVTSQTSACASPVRCLVCLFATAAIIIAVTKTHNSLNSCPQKSAIFSEKHIRFLRMFPHICVTSVGGRDRAFRWQREASSCLLSVVECQQYVLSVNNNICFCTYRRKKAKGKLLTHEVFVLKFLCGLAKTWGCLNFKECADGKDTPSESHAGNTTCSNICNFFIFRRMFSNPSPGRNNLAGRMRPTSRKPRKQQRKVIFFSAVLGVNKLRGRRLMLAMAQYVRRPKRN